MLSENIDEADSDLPKSPIDRTVDRSDKERSLGEVKKIRNKSVAFKDTAIKLRDTATTIMYQIVEPKIEYLTSKKLKE